MASLTHITYTNDGEPYFVKGAPNPLSTGTALYSPIVVVNEFGLPYATTITTTDVGNTVIGNTNALTSTSIGSINITNSGVVQIDNLGAANPIQSWFSTGTTITEPITLVQTGVANPFTIGQKNSGIGYTSLSVANNNNPSSPEINFFDNGKIELNSTVVVTNTTTGILVNTNSATTALNGLGLNGSTPNAKQWQMVSNTDGIKITADLNNGFGTALTVDQNNNIIMNSTIRFQNNGQQVMRGNSAIYIEGVDGSAQNSFNLIPTGFTLWGQQSTANFNLSMTSAANPSSIAFVTNFTNLSTMNIFDNKVQAANLQTFPGSLIVNNSEAYKTNDIPGGQITFNAVEPNQNVTELISNFNPAVGGDKGFSFWSGSTNTAKESLTKYLYMNPANGVVAVQPLTSLSSITAGSNIVAGDKVLAPSTVSNFASASTMNVGALTAGSINGIVGGLIPTGGILPWAGGSFASPSLPAGYLLCDGRFYSRTTYSVLYSVIGSTWGFDPTGNAFGVPNLNNTTIFGSPSVQTNPFTATFGSIDPTSSFPPGFPTWNFAVYFTGQSQSVIAPGDYFLNPAGGQSVFTQFYDFDGSVNGTGVAFTNYDWIGSPIAFVGRTVYPNIQNLVYPGVTAGGNFVKQTQSQVAGHVHTGVTNQQSTALNGANNTTGASNDTSINKGLASYSAGGGSPIVNVTNVNSVMNILPSRAYMFYIIKT